MRFEQVMTAVARGEVEAGVIIHEGRFTFGAHGLEQVVDLGERWESTTDLPLPLGLICARRSLPEGITDMLERGLRESIELAFREPHRSRTFVRQHAQEMDPDVCRQHIDLYVNDFSVDLGNEGVAAVDELFARGKSAGMIEASASAWR
jgi:1,4-dihydroxy-6-naphthoate synthase